MRAAPLSFLLLLGACSRGPGLVVEAGPVPLSATVIQPYLSVKQTPSQAIAPFSAIPGQVSQSFGLRLPVGESGAGHVSAAALDGNGCYLATGVADTQVADGDQVTLPLDVLPAPRCETQRPLILSVIPALAPTQGGATVSLRGAGLAAGIRASFGGTASAATTWGSPIDLSVSVPPHQGIAAVPVAVTNLDGTMNQLATPFRYYSTAPDFTVADHALNAFNQDLTVPAMAIGLLDANPYPDLVGLLSAPLQGVLVILNSRLTIAQLGSLPVLYPLTGVPLAAAVGVLSDSGNNDIAVSVQSDNHVYVLYNQGDGTYWKNAAAQTADMVQVSVGGQPGAVAIADVNDDGLPDLLVANQNKTLNVALRIVNRTFAGAHDYSLDLAPRDLAVGDLTGDGRADVVVVYQGADYGVDLLVNQGDGTFPAALYRQMRADNGATTLHQPVLADFDGDGHLDLAFTSEVPGQVSVWLNVDGQFVSPLRTAYAVAMNPVSLATGDINGDGLPDLVALPAAGTSIAVLLNQLGKPGAFQLYGKSFAVEQGSHQVAILDADDNGTQDIGVLGVTQLVAMINSSP